VQAAILNLLVDLQTSKGVSYIFISHDLAVVRYVADRIGVMYLGQLVEVGPTDAVYQPPHHPYTEALMSAVPPGIGRKPDAHQAERRLPQHGRPAERLPLPRPLSSSARRCVPNHRATLAGG
jgi:peptide/nickel transport system ATP-binding protein